MANNKGLTIVESFLNTCNRQPSSTALMHKIKDKWHAITFDEFKTKTLSVSALLVNYGIESGDRVGILSSNRPEWVIADIGILTAGAVTVPLYDTLLSVQIEHILKDSECKLIFVENKSQFLKIKELNSRIPFLKYIIVMDPFGVPLEETVSSFSEILEKGGKLLNAEKDLVRNRYEKLVPDDLASIVYTSGTTGIPKGVMLSHGNFMSNAQDILSVVNVNGDDLILCFLPLSHVLERTAGFFTGCVTAGAKYAFAESIEKVGDNLREITPTILVAVPRLFEKVYARIMNTVQSSSTLRKAVFRWALRTGERSFRAKMQGVVKPFGEVKQKLATLLVFKKIHERVGGNIRLLISGGAPLEPRIAEFFASVGLSVYEGYGLTETSPVTNVNRPDKYRIGTVGTVLPSVEVKIAQDGEILVKGPNVMKGYYKKPEATAEVFTQDGWLKTGDIGRIDEDGFLYVTDRKKEIIVTSGGKNIAPQPIENLLKTNSYINQVMLIGDRKHFVAALVVPNFINLSDWAGNNGIGFDTHKNLINLPQIIEKMELEIKETAKNLPRYEQIKKIILLADEWSIETGELTPTMKLKRQVILQNYRALIEDLYMQASSDSY
ncbi:long-chain fatty acid--CoA ligase [bacterium]|nr:long-chain fatty acid--CoA ligase [candidate division CSSED10-310 bacterium]